MINVYSPVIRAQPLKSSPDKCTTVPRVCRPTDQANWIGPKSKSRSKPHPTLPCYTLLSLKADIYFNFHHRVESRAHLGGWLHSKTVNLH